MVWGAVYQRGDGALKYEVKQDGSRVVLRLADRLVHQDRTAFDRVCTEVLSSRPNQVDVDFRDLTYMDSAGLGFLLTLREQAGKSGSTLALINPQGSVREMLELSRFDTLFTIRTGG